MGKNKPFNLSDVSFLLCWQEQELWRSHAFGTKYS